jgi:urease accessory protein
MIRFSFRQTTLVAAGMTALSVAAPAFAHPGLHHAAISMASGFSHPFSGLDHVLAFAAIGLWTAQYQDRKAWLLPLLFLAVMALGALAGHAGIRIPGIEAGIAATVAILGLLVAFAIRMQLAPASALVSVFALLHGYAHGIELPYHASITSYGIGFIAATALLELTGMLAGLGASRYLGNAAVRLAGAGVALSGIFLFPALA